MTDQPETDRSETVTLVLGATGSVGTQLCRDLTRAGGQVMAAGRNTDRLSQLADELNCASTTFEAREIASIEAAIDDTVKRFERLDAVANCAGSVLLKPAHQTSDQEWHDTLTLNLTSCFAVVRAATRQMRRHGGSIVLVSSAAARIGLPNHEAIAAAKAGIIGLTQSAAATYASRGIRVNAVAPGLVKSRMTETLWKDEAAAAASIDMHALGRLGDPADVASAIAWLLDNRNSWITGQILGVDGGLGSIVSKVRR